MRCVLFSCVAFMCVVASAQTEPVRADPLPGAPAQPAIDRPVHATITVTPFQVTSPELPKWLGHSFQQLVSAELSASGLTVLDSSAATQPSSDYTVRGECGGNDVMMRVKFDVLHTDSESVVRSVTISGRPTELLQMRSALRVQLRTLFAART
jgi:hypothetical protein